ncbi:MAG: ABC-2 family transporter protein [Chloroflexi bacterium]|nr:ABC-2 family transporter protein [Chloroflexota bacterium]
MRYLRLLGIFMRAGILVELEYRANFAVRVLLSLSWTAVTLIGTTVLFTQTGDIGGWTYYEALVIAGLFTAMGGIIQALLQPNVQKIIEMVRLGTLDFLLTKPVNSQFMASLRHSQIYSVTDVLSGAAIVVFSLSRLGYAPDTGSLAAFIVMFVMALLIVYSIWIAMATLSFWFVQVGNLTELFSAVYDTARFPVSTFQGLLRVFLTLVAPIAFITTFPAQAILGKLDGGILPLAVGMGVTTFVASAWFWRYAVRTYSSASS